MEAVLPNLHGSAGVLTTHRHRGPCYSWKGERHKWITWNTKRSQRMQISHSQNTGLQLPARREEMVSKGTGNSPWWSWCIPKSWIKPVPGGIQNSLALYLCLLVQGMLEKSTTHQGSLAGCILNPKSLTPPMPVDKTLSVLALQSLLPMNWIQTICWKS